MVHFPNPTNVTNFNWFFIFLCIVHSATNSLNVLCKYAIDSLSKESIHQLVMNNMQSLSCFYVRCHDVNFLNIVKYVLFWLFTCHHKELGHAIGIIRKSSQSQVAQTNFMIYKSYNKDTNFIIILWLLNSRHVYNNQFDSEILKNSKTSCLKFAPKHNHIKNCYFVCIW